MKFRILLLLLAKLMKRANKKNLMFRKIAASKNVIFELRTEDKKTVRHFIFNQGEFQTQPTSHHAPDFSIVFTDSRFGFSVLTSKDKQAFINGILDKKIVIEGDFTLVIWFQILVSLLKKQKTAVPTHLSTIGFVGAGLIGAPMIRSLIRNHFAVKVFDTNPLAMESVTPFGAIECKSLREFADTGLVVVMVNNIKQVREVVFEICEKRLEKTTFNIVVMSTVSPDDIVRLQKDLIQNGFPYIRLMDAPVSGAPLNAEAGKLAIMAGGEKADFERVKPVLEAMGETIFYLGELGCGASMKLVNNILGLTSGLITVEALFLGIKKGLMPEQMIQVINTSSGQNFLTRQWPLTVKLFEMVTEGEVYGAKDAIFKTGMKDLMTTKEWAASDGIELRCLEDGINNLDYLSGGEFDTMLKAILGKSA
ncbi:NAD(P)-dependent oxidoreductase [bacterium]|nr:NAD(P)-dependent oxidoreductase [bacterium]